MGNRLLNFITRIQVYKTKILGNRSDRKNGACLFQKRFESKRLGTLLIQKRVIQGANPRAKVNEVFTNYFCQF